jgi:hypothetical protein
MELIPVYLMKKREGEFDYGSNTVQGKPADLDGDTEWSLHLAVYAHR